MRESNSLTSRILGPRLAVFAEHRRKEHTAESSRARARWIGSLRCVCLPLGKRGAERGGAWQGFGNEVFLSENRCLRGFGAQLSTASAELRGCPRAAVHDPSFRTPRSRTDERPKGCEPLEYVFRLQGIPLCKLGISLYKQIPFDQLRNQPAPTWLLF